MNSPHSREAVPSTSRSSREAGIDTACRQDAVRSESFVDLVVCDLTSSIHRSIMLTGDMHLVRQDLSSISECLREDLLRCAVSGWWRPSSPTRVSDHPDRRPAMAPFSALKLSRLSVMCHSASVRLTSHMRLAHKEVPVLLVSRTDPFFVVPRSGYHMHSLTERWV